MTGGDSPSAEPSIRGTLVERLVPLGLLLLGIAGTLPVVRSLRVADLNWCYPYLSPDSYDWINNGLYWAGAPLLPSYRPPGLPLLIALLVRIGALSWLPALNFVALGVTAVLLFRLLRERFSPSVSALTAWTFYVNDFSQDLAKYVSAEVYATLFLVLAAILFLLAWRRPGLYVPFGLALGVSFLFHHAALPAGIGFGFAVLGTRRDHLRLRPLWLGAAAATLVSGGWVTARALYYRGHPGVLTHLQTELLAFVPGNVLFYAFAATALVGLAALPVHLLGVLRTLEPAAGFSRAFRAAFGAPLIGITAFFALFYDWVDKRFLFYVLPFLMVFFAEGANGLIEFGKRRRNVRLAIWTYLAAAALWTQIRYPSYGIGFLALTPRDFIELRRVVVAGRTSFHLGGARVVRKKETIRGAFSGASFDFSLRPAACRLDAPEYVDLLNLKRALDERLKPGIPVGLTPLAGWPEDPWLCWNRLSNVLGRPVVRPDRARCRVTDRETEGEVQVLRSGRYRVVCPM